MIIIRKMAFTLLLFTVFGMAVFARDVEILVEDEDLGLPLEGAVVALRSGEQFTAGRTGIALVVLPNEGQAVVQVSYPGYDTQRLVIPPASGTEELYSVTVKLRLGGIMVGRELVVEAPRPEASETKSGRSVAISEKELTRTAEIGIIEDVMSSVKLLPGVGYTGMFGALPSIRGGDPGDMMTTFDGFYLERPFHWVGAVSIFDPKMVSSARLSHGVFSSRYGHTISGLLEITSKSPSPTETELDMGIGTSAASLNMSFPFNGKGGILLMGKLTYWDPFILMLQGISKVANNENLDRINYITTSPYIRSGAIAANYWVTPNLEWQLNSFFGSDGVGANVKNKYDNEDTWGTMNIDADYNNYQGFLISGITASPSPSLAIKATGGLGFMRTITEDWASNNITARYNQDFLDSLAPYPILGTGALTTNSTYTAPDLDVAAVLEHNIFNAQLRSDIDWELGKGFITAFGVQELYSMWSQRQNIDLFLEMPIEYLTGNPFFIFMLPPKYINSKDLQDILTSSSLPDNLEIILPYNHNSNIFNQGFTTSAYGLFEYLNPDRGFGAELGLRIDHLYLIGRNFSAQTLPAFNPRFNIDVNILKNVNSIESLDFTAGTGLFSSINKFVSFMGVNNDKKFNIKFDRSWTSIIGLSLDIEQGYSFNIEGYYKRVFNRSYITADTETSSIIDPTFNFDGIGNVWGFDLQLQKLESRFWDGWISYTFTWAKYLDPSGGGSGVNNASLDSVGEEWYYPSYHRFHNANIVLNFKPLQWFNIALRFGLASGQIRNVVDNKIYSYPVLTVDDNGNVAVLQKYRRDSKKDKNGKIMQERAAWSLPLDLKFSFFLFDRKGRVGTEIYLAAENLMSLVYKPKGSTRFNTYTGKEDAEPSSGTSGLFELPFPMVSFGFKWRY